MSINNTNQRPTTACASLCIARRRLLSALSHRPVVYPTCGQASKKDNQQHPLKKKKIKRKNKTKKKKKNTAQHRFVRWLARPSRNNTLDLASHRIASQRIAASFCFALESSKSIAADTKTPGLSLSLGFRPTSAAQRSAATPLHLHQPPARVESSRTGRKSQKDCGQRVLLF